MDQEQGFYHPDVGYWQTTNEPSAEILSTYPLGFKRIPLRPGKDYVWENEEWIYRVTPFDKGVIDKMRSKAYKKEADPLFFKAQRGEVTMQTWLDKVEEIRQRYSDPA